MAFPLLPILGLIDKVFDRVIPDPGQAAQAKIALLELQQKGELAFLDADLRVALAQAGINAEEAKSPSLFKSGWRPYVGWTCAAGFTWAFVLQPIVVFVFAAAGHPIKELPAIDTGVMVTMLGGLLGLGGMRSYERYKGVERP